MLSRTILRVKNQEIGPVNGAIVRHRSKTAGQEAFDLLI